MTPLLLAPGPAPDSLGIGIGVAAFILVAGWIATRWHRDQLRFALMKTALERGVTRFAGMPPYWVVSLRQGVTLVAVGFGLTAIGAGAWWLARGVTMPTPQELSATHVAQGQQGPEHVERPLPPPEHEDHDGPPLLDDRQPPPPRGQGHSAGKPPMKDDQHPGPPPPRREDEHRGGRDEHDGPPGHGEREAGRPEHMPPGNPALERWRRAEAQQTIGLVTCGAGLVLLLVGMVRIGFSKIEQRYVGEGDDAGVY